MISTTLTRRCIVGLCPEHRCRLDEPGSIAEAGAAYVHKAEDNSVLNCRREDHNGSRLRTRVVRAEPLTPIFGAWIERRGSGAAGKRGTLGDVKFERAAIKNCCDARAAHCRFHLSKQRLSVDLSWIGFLELACVDRSTSSLKSIIKVARGPKHQGSLQDYREQAEERRAHQRKFNSSSPIFRALEAMFQVCQRLDGGLHMPAKHTADGVNHSTIRSFLSETLICLGQETTRRMSS